MIKKNTRKAFSLVEVILAIAIFSLIVLSAGTVFVYTQKNLLSSAKKNKAILLADEALEALRNIKDDDFNNLFIGSYFLSEDTGSFSLVQGVEDIDKFQRSIEIEEVDENTKKAVVEVSWEDNLQDNKLLSVEQYFTNWRKETPQLFNSCGEYCEYLLYKKGSCKAKESQCTRVGGVLEPEGDIYCSNDKFCCCSN